MMAITTACQKEAPTLAGLLANVSVQASMNLTKPDIEKRERRGVMMTNDDINGRVAGGAILTIPKALSAFEKVIFLTFDDGVEGFSGVTMRERKGFLESIKKGGISATPEYVGQSAILHFGHYETFVVDCVTDGELDFKPSGVSLAFLRWRRLISVCMEATINCPVLSPSSFICSIASTTSCGTRAFNACDFAFFSPVAMTEYPYVKCATVYTEKEQIKELTWATLKIYSGPHLDFVGVKSSDAPECLEPLLERLTSNVMETNAMAKPQCNQTHPKFQYRFLAISRIDRNAKPCRMSVEAHTEREARQVLAPHFILSLAACLPLQGIREIVTPSGIAISQHLQGMGEISIPSTIEQISTVQEVSHA